MSVHKTEIRVIYGDTDTMGRVYYACYFRWFEAARTEMFRFMGLTYKSMEEKGLFLPVSETYCKYVSPILYDDLIVIETAIDTKIVGSVKFNYGIMRKNENIPLAKGYTRHACIDNTGKLIRPPTFLRKLIADILNAE